MAQHKGKDITFVYGDSDSQSIHVGQHRSHQYNTEKAFKEYIEIHKGADSMSAFGTSYHLLWTFKGHPETYNGEIRKPNIKELREELAEYKS